MSAKIVMTDIDGERFDQYFTTVARGRKAMRTLSFLIGRAFREDKPGFLGIGGGQVTEDDEYCPSFSIRTDYIKSLRLLEDESDEEEAPEKSPPSDEPDTEDPDWWKKKT